MRLKKTYSSREVAALTGLTARQLQLWETAARYLMYGGVAMVLVGLFARQGGVRGVNGAG